jgi:putative transposase
MGIEAVSPRRRTTIPGGPSGVAPYLLKDMEISHGNQVCSMDITYIPMRRGFRFYVSFRGDGLIFTEDYELGIVEYAGYGFLFACFAAGGDGIGRPEIVNTDQGCQFTAEKWHDYLIGERIRQSMDGRGHWVDNVVIERFWRTIKYEDIYLKSYENPVELERGAAA